VLISGSFTSYNGTGRNRIARFNSDGSLDLTFNPGTGASGVINSIALLSDGRIFIGGAFTNYNGAGWNRIARLNGAGSLDTSFFPSTGTDSDVRCLAVQADGKVLIGGYFNLYNGTENNRIARIHSDGKPNLLTQPQAQTIIAGTNVTFSLSATSIAPLTYQWQFNGTNLIGATNSTLSFIATNRSFMGAYSVFLTYPDGSVTSSPARLRVLVPQRLQPPQRQSDGRFLLRFGDFDGGLASASDLMAFEVYATTNLFTTNSWVRLTNGVSVVNGQVQIEDKDTQDLPRRFYRIIER